MMMEMEQASSDTTGSSSSADSGDPIMEKDGIMKTEGGGNHAGASSGGGSGGGGGRGGRKGPRIPCLGDDDDLELEELEAAAAPEMPYDDGMMDVVPTGGGRRRLAGKMFWLVASATALAAICSVAFLMGRKSVEIAVDSVGADSIGQLEKGTMDGSGERSGDVIIAGQKDASPSLSQTNGAVTEIIRAEIKEKRESNNEPWPALSSILRETDDGKNTKQEIVGDVQFLLDFAIVGHSKTATTAQMRWMCAHEEIQMYNRELHSLKNGKPEELVELLYALPEGRQFKRGYKSPNDIVKAISMESIRTYWPKTKLIVGVRHPVKWFESYYNFNVRQGNNMKPAEEMVGRHFSEKPKYHEHLAMLGKTRLVDRDEYELLGLDRPVTPPLMSNEVFMYEVSQPFDHNRTRAEIYTKDISNFIGLSRPLEPIVPRASKGGNYHYAIDVCDDKYIQLREELMAVSRNASQWISRYFLDHPDVTVSSKEHFRNDILASWMTDPCAVETRG